MSQSRGHYGVVGGGLMGLTLALRLAERGERVTLFEGADHVGGLADAWQLGDIVWDRHYHVTLLSDQHLRGVLRELDLDDQMQWIQTKTSFLVDGKLHPFSSSLDFLRFAPLSLWSKMRLAWTIWYASKINKPDELHRTPLADWLIRQSGRQTFERFWLPLLKAKLGDAWQRTSAAFIWATIQRLYAARRTGLKREMFGYLPGGYARLLAALEQRLESLGVTLRTGFRVAGIVANDRDGLEVRSEDEAIECDRVVVTTPAPVTARLCGGLSATEREHLEGAEYLGIVCASVLLKKPLAGYYVTNVLDPVPFTGVIEMTGLVDPAQFGGRGLIYLPKYATQDDRIWSKNDEQVRHEFLTDLARCYPGFSVDDVLAFRVSRVRNVFALSTLGRVIPPMTTSMRGLYVVNSAQIEHGTLNVNETVRLAEGALDTICQPLPQGAPLGIV